MILNMIHSEHVAVEFNMICCTDRTMRAAALHAKCEHITQFLFPQCQHMDQNFPSQRQLMLFNMLVKSINVHVIGFDNK